jgi:hypothetical protein
MALESPSRPASPGLTSQVATLTEGMASLVARLDPDTLLGADATALYAALARLERLVGAAKVLLAPRIATSGHWEAEGHRSPASLLADLEGVSPGQAKRTLTTGQRLVGLPGTEEALRAGRLSGPQVAEIAETATVDPGAESSLLAGAGSESLRATKERCLRARAAAAHHDPVATARRIHAERHFTHWNDAEGAFCFAGKDTPERGAALLARLVPAAHRLAQARQAGGGSGGTSGSGSGGGSSDTPSDTAGALRADALFALVTGVPTAGGGTGTGVGTGSGGTGGGVGDGDGDGPTPGLLGADHIIDRPPSATVIVRVDRDALVRGRVGPGERCELDGMGPIPVPLARALAVDSFLALVFTEAGDIRAVRHLGRTINATLRTALAFRDRGCVVPGCAMPYGLEIDHVHPVALGGPTALDNLALLCRHHHRLKTYDGWVLERHGPSDEDPGWSFSPPPAFGQEPDLGLDRPDATPMPTSRRRDRPPDADPPAHPPPPDRPPPADPRSDRPPPDSTLFDRPPVDVPRVGVSRRERVGGTPPPPCGCPPGPTSR